MKIVSIKNKKVAILAICVAIILVVVGGVSAYFVLRRPAGPEATTNGTGDTFNKVDYSPANETDKQYNDRLKEDLGKEANKNDSTDNGKQSVKPTIVDAGQYGSSIEIRSLISGVVESTGVCKIVFNGPSNNVVTKQVAAVADASSTRCENLEFGKSELPQNGEWRVIVEYTSSLSEGKSEERSFSVR